MVGVGLEPSSGLRVRKKRKETTIIEVNTIYSPELLNGWDLHMARPRQTDRLNNIERRERETNTHMWSCTHASINHPHTNMISCTFSTLTHTRSVNHTPRHSHEEDTAPQDKCSADVASESCIHS